MATRSRPQLLEPVELRAWRGMLRAHATLSRQLDAQLEAAHGLPLTSYEVLLYVGDAPQERLRMAELATSVLLSRSGLTRMVDRLVRDGLLEREACPEDARGAFAKLTPKGREVLDAARTTHLDGVRRLFLAHLSPQEQELLGAMWERVLAPADEQP
jgi:DNA-binding MarR family transcriptional regulator